MKPQFFILLFAVPSILCCSDPLIQQAGVAHQNFLESVSVQSYDPCSPDGVDPDLLTAFGTFLGAFGLGQTCNTDDDCDPSGCQLYPLSLVCLPEAACYRTRCPIPTSTASFYGFCFCRPASNC